jgi:hypothetical protein
MIREWNLMKVVIVGWNLKINDYENARYDHAEMCNLWG